MIFRKGCHEKKNPPIQGTVRGTKVEKALGAKGWIKS